ncbi:hypothetical protein ACE1AT_22975, partial [Pelatocladus sp. BLCC-F211]|uniref:hypothetical protein n=1 Tax=Pelatocladus sp. BLCC-F211 TaxID=3342752 RepID=UPI0035BA2DA0
WLCHSKSNILYPAGSKLRLVAVVFFVFATLKYNQTTQLNSLAIHLTPPYRVGVSLLAVKGNF